MNILDFLGFQLVLNNLYFVIRHGKTRREQDVSQILYWLGVKFTFLCFDIKTNLAKTLKYFFYMPVMFVHIIQVDEYIIQIYHNTNIQNIRKNIIYKSLKSYRSISKTKGYYRPFKWSIVCSKSSLPFITIGNVNQMVSMVKIYFWINLSFVRWVQ